MADVKLSALPTAGSVTTDDFIPVVDNAGPTTQKVTVTTLRAALFPVSLTTDVTGTLPVANGGTGASSLPAGGLAGITAMNAGDATSVSTAATNAAAAIVTERTTAATLTNKTIAAASNTITGLTNANMAAAQAIAALAIDWNAGNVFTKTLSAGGNTFTWANAAGGKTIVVRLTGAASTVTWPAVPTLKWAGGSVPVQTTSGTDVYTFVHDGTGIYGSVVQAFA